MTDHDRGEIGSLFAVAAPLPAPEPAPTRMTEADMLDLLVKRYSVHYGNGARYAFAKHVRSHAGFDARRTADFVAMDLWPSKGLRLHGHEVKVSRSDWLVELKHPEKAAEFIPYMDYWWLVVSDRDIVRAGGWVRTRRGVRRPMLGLRRPLRAWMVVRRVRGLVGEFGCRIGSGRLGKKFRKTLDMT